MNVWTEYNEIELDDYKVQVRRTGGKHRRVEYRLVHASSTLTDRRGNLISKRKLASASQLKALEAYVDSQINRLPLFENINETQDDEKKRYVALQRLLADFSELHDKLSKSSTVLDDDKITSLIYDWSFLLESIYEKQNAELRTRFLRSQNNKMHRRSEKREATKNARLNSTQQHKNAVKSADDYSYLYRETAPPSTYSQYLELNRKASLKSLHYTLHHDKANQTLFVKPKRNSSLTLRYNDLHKMKTYFSKTRVLNGLINSEKVSLDKHEAYVDLIYSKHKDKLIDEDLLRYWIELYELWSTEKDRFRKFKDDMRNNAAHYPN